MNPTNLTSGVNRVTVTTTAPTQITDGVADDANIAGMFIYTRVPVRIWQMNNANAWSELDVLTGASGSRIVTVYFDATDVTRIFLQSMGADGALVRVVRREEAASVVQQDGVNNRVVGGTGVGPQGPAGPAGADGATGPQGPAGPSGGGLTANHIHTGSLTIDIPGPTTGWCVSPEIFYKADWAAMSWEERVGYDNPSSTGLIANVTSTHSGNITSNIYVGGQQFSNPPISPGYHPAYVTSINYGWAPIHGEKDFRFLNRLNGGVDFHTWHDSELIFQDSNPRFYTFGPMGGGPKGPKIEVTGSLIMSPRSNIFIGDPSASGFSEYPEYWNAGTPDALFLSQHMFVNNSNDTYYQFGDKRSYMQFASQSYIDFRNSHLHLYTYSSSSPSAKFTFMIADPDHPDNYYKKIEHTMIDGFGKVNLPSGTICHDLNLGGDEPPVEGLHRSPLVIRQQGHAFQDGIALTCNYGADKQGWGMRSDSSRELVFQAFQLDGNGDLIDGTYNDSSFGRGYLSDGTDVGQITFTGQHRSLPAAGTVADFENKVGLIVVSTGKYGSMTPEDITVNDAMPKVELSSTANDKRAFGVVSNVEDVDSDERRFQLGAWGSSMTKPDGDDRVIINSVGEGGMWITDINGNLENGDYITTSDLPGYGMKQDGVQLCNYTVAKITMDCDFDLNSTEYRCEQLGAYKKAFVGVTYHCG